MQFRRENQQQRPGQHLEIDISQSNDDVETLEGHVTRKRKTDQCHIGLHSNTGYLTSVKEFISVVQQFDLRHITYVSLNIHHGFQGDSLTVIDTFFDMVRGIWPSNTTELDLFLDTTHLTSQNGFTITQKIAAFHWQQQFQTLNILGINHLPNMVYPAVDISGFSTLRHITLDQVSVDATMFVTFARATTNGRCLEVNNTCITGIESLNTDGETGETGFQRFLGCDNSLLLKTEIKFLHPFSLHIQFGVYNFWDSRTVSNVLTDWVEHKHKIAAVYDGPNARPKTKSATDVFNILNTCNNEFRLEINSVRAIYILLRKQNLIESIQAAA